jgi:hypothetical protein
LEAVCVVVGASSNDLRAHRVAYCAVHVCGAGAV